MVLGGPYANIANIYVIRHDDQLVVVDTAETENDYMQIQRGLAEWGLERYPVSHVLISHKHRNHIGNLWRFRKDYPDAVFVAGASDADAIESGDEHEIHDFDPFPAREDYVPAKIDLRVKDLDTFTAAGIRFTVYEVPGHTAGSVFYKFEWEGKTVWLTGDVLSVAGDCFGAYLGWEGAIDFDRGVFFDSIKRFSKFEGDILLPGHFGLCMQDATRIFNDAYRIPFEEWRKPSVGRE